MYQKTKAELKIFSVLLLATIVLILLIIFCTNTQPLIVVAQGPKDDTHLSIDEETLAAFGLSPDAIQTATGPFDLDVDVTADKTQVANGDTITFFVTITNNGPQAADYILFKNSFPTNMNNVNYQFSVPEHISNGQANPTWLLPGQIAVGGKVQVTITGKVVGPVCDITGPNTAEALPWYSGADTETDNNVAKVTIKVSGQYRCFYFPSVFRAEPTPTPNPVLYYDDFSNSDSGWPTGDDGNCNSKYDSGNYRLDVDANDTCWRFGPSDRTEFTYATFELKAYHSDNKSDAAYGIYINGEGGDDYYLFRIWPNNDCSSGGDWELIRSKSDDSDTVMDGNCHSSIIRGTGSPATNILKIRHTSDRKIYVYVNGILLGIFKDSSEKHRTGEGTGVYAKADNDDITIKFTEFKISNP